MRGTIFWEIICDRCDYKTMIPLNDIWDGIIWPVPTGWVEQREGTDCIHLCPKCNQTSFIKREETK
jgi:hypothetical protein